MAEQQKSQKGAKKLRRCGKKRGYYANHHYVTARNKARRAANRERIAEKRALHRLNHPRLSRRQLRRLAKRDHVLT